ncbi:acyl carrier protein [Catenulispora sp. NF23]|uniref:Acyl carrier protein n=1 Tax=Catenulispora pinistramenti TaxID=2705254 RepID=A0ABS5KVJ5_9ACTN|nr:acyl carrier protein [Catenulispora pinistramenti]MBS2535455.1 acyl carrier protein [Catenulispora pinistramenti]MBS2550066.1 acyl carrier protein [Catenulispora pinistramenti]
MSVNTEFYPIVAEVVAELAEIPVEQISAEKSLRDELALDSLTLVELWDVLAERLGMRFPDDDVAAIVSVGEIVTYAHAHR